MNMINYCGSGKNAPALSEMTVSFYKTFMKYIILPSLGESLVKNKSGFFKIHNLAFTHLNHRKIQLKSLSN